MLYSDLDKKRHYTDYSSTKNVYRSDYCRDIARLIHCPSFRRLQGKTQLFAGEESDFFRNRLTHSLEVSHIAKMIAKKLNFDLDKLHEKKITKEKYEIDSDLVYFAGLAHDLGHPPFGHIGEKALDEIMKDYGGFEGNAQTFRILTTLEKKILDSEANSVTYGIGTKGGKVIDHRKGLNLTYRTFASILKYDQEIPIKFNDRKKLNNKKITPLKGYYSSDSILVLKMKEMVTGVHDFNKEFKTIECQIMDIADDISYSTYDLEDCFKAGFIEPLDFITADQKGEIISSVVDKMNEDKKSITSQRVKEVLNNAFRGLFDFDYKREGSIRPDEKILEMSKFDIKYSISKRIVQNGYFRTAFTSALVNDYVNSVVIDVIDDKRPALSKIKLSKEKGLNERLEVLKHYVYATQVLSPKMKIVAYRGETIVKEIFEILLENHGEFLPYDYRKIYERLEYDIDRRRTICDFVAGMTNRYALEFYGRLKSENPQTIFKPL